MGILLATYAIAALAVAYAFDWSLARGDFRAAGGNCKRALIASQKIYQPKGSPEVVPNELQRKDASMQERQKAIVFFLATFVFLAV